VQIFPSGLLQMTNARNGFLALIISDPDSLLARKSLIGPAKIAERKNLGSIRSRTKMLNRSGLLPFRASGWR
jgi:hypothetical protein